MLKLPLTDNYSQRYSTLIGGTSYVIEIQFNSRTKIWNMGISSNNIKLIEGIPLVPGIDLIKPYLYIEGMLNFKNLFIVNTVDDTSEITSLNFSTDNILVILTDSEVNDSGF